MVKRYDCDVCYNVGMTSHASGDWVSYSDYAALLKELESKIALLEVQLKLSEAAERAWESSMMQACGEDGPKSVADKFAELQAKCAELAAENTGLKTASSCLVSEYIMNKGADNEFIACITPSKKTIGTGGVWDMWRHLDMALDTTPATDAFLAEVRAQGVEMFAIWNDKCIEKGDEYENVLAEVGVAARGFAVQLRQGAAL